MVDEELLSHIFKSSAKIIDKLHGGMMNESFIVSSNNKKYVLYMPTAQANEMVDRCFEKENIQRISSLNITSKNIYFDENSGIKANEYIEGHSLNYVNEYNYAKIANLLHNLHDKGDKSNRYYDPFNRLEGFIKERELLINKVDDSYQSLYEFVINNKDYLENDKLVLSHNDFQRSNIIEDNDSNYWMIDFEFMADNSEIYDIACFGNDKVSEGLSLLYAYKNNSPTNEDIKRYFLWRIFVSLQWYNVALIKHFRGEGDAHKINFYKVAEHFIDNAKEAFRLLHKI